MLRLPSTRLICATRATCAALAVLAALSLQAGLAPAYAQVAPAHDAVPTGGQVVAGSASIANGGTAAAPVVTVQQDSARAIVNWGSFNVGRDASVVFRQPDAHAVILNRVLDTQPSQIFGNMTANGQVFLMNPAGVWFGAGASVDVGALVATTHAISDADFMAGTYRFGRNGATGKVVNEGRIEAKLGGYVALLAPEVRNDGFLVAQSGTIALAAGETVTLNVNPANSKVDLLVEPSRIAALVENRKIVKAPDGAVIVSAQAYNELASGVIKNSGEIVATGITRAGGKIVLAASAEVANSGKLDASSAVANGGSVRIDADTVRNSGEIRVGSSSQNGKGGEAILTGNYIYIEDGAKIDATGTIGGGKVLVGGDWQGQGDLRHAIRVAMDANAAIDASALSRGDGGTLVLWSEVARPDSLTTVAGTLLARGGALGGNGGKIETSGGHLIVEGAEVSASAARGAAGEWLLDPHDIEIKASGSSNATQSGTLIYSTNTPSVVDVATIRSALNGGSSVTVRTSDGSGTGAITVNAAIEKTSGGDATLTLQAADNVVINQPISSTSNRLHLNFYADTDQNGGNNGAGVTIINSNLTTNGGNINFGAGNRIDIGSVSTLVGGDVYVQGSNAVTFSTKGGAVTVNGEMLIGNSAGLTIDTTGGTSAGNVTFNSALNSSNQYARVDKVLSWEGAVSDAKSGNGDAAGNTYLATITSRLENAIANQAAGYQSSWLGGRRVVGIGTDNLWRWVTGPEGLADGGKGLAFSSQNSGGGATSYNGYFNTWSGGEPNNWNGSSPGALNTELESALQFTGSLGVWNDLPKSGTTLSYYVRETNATPSNLTVRAGSGNVFFNQAVGSQKALGNIDISGNSVTIVGGVTTEGTQTYNANVNIGSGNLSLTTRGPATSGFDILFNNGITKSGAGDVTLTVKSHRDIYVNSNIAASGGKLNILFDADTEDSGNGGTPARDGVGFIQVNGDIVTNGGTLQFGTKGTASISGANVQVGGDVYLAGSTAQTINTGGGTLTVNGEVMLANTNGLSISTNGGNVVFDGVLNSANSYAFVPKVTGVNDTWSRARDQAKSGTGSAPNDTYLATITSRLENAIASRAANYGTAWVGGSRGGAIDPSASDDWYWVTGPEGLANGGRGTLFFNQTSAQTSTTPVGGTAADGAYINWNVNGSGQRIEPNSTGEKYLQFTGTKGLWNDLSGTDTTPSGYVRERNAVPSAVTINAGSGSVTFNQAVGTSKELSTLSITSGSLTAGAIRTTQALNLTTTNAVTLASEISGTGSLTKNGTNTLTLGANNSYTGSTTIGGGSVLVGTGGTTGSLGTGNVVNNGSLTFNRSDAIVVPNTISGSGSLTKQGSSSLSLTGANSYSGGTTLSAGTLGVYHNTALGTGAVSAANNSILMFGRAVNSVGNNFTLNGNVTFDFDNSVDYLIVAGGGGGGAWVGGGGGGGGVLTGNFNALGNSFAVTVGGGGTGASYFNGLTTSATSGGNSSVFGLTAFGGGNGGSWSAQAPSTGGSGGGQGNGTTAVAGTAGQGFAGGTALGTSTYGYPTGGGGGAGGVGGNWSATKSGDGGVGLGSSITGTLSYYGGGGGGGVHGQSGADAAAGLGGLGGGGNGNVNTGTQAGSGIANTGGGGGGAGRLSTASSQGGTGGSGIVIARYLGGSAGTGGTVSAGSGSASGYTLHTFTSTGTSTLAFSPLSVILSGAISGTGSMNADATGGTIQFSGNSSYTGSTSIAGGIVQTNSVNALGSNSAVTVGNLAGVLMQVLSNTTIGSLSGVGTLGGNVAISSGATLNTGGSNASTTYGGAISGAGTLEKSGTGTFTLTNTNTYGNTTISGGTLAIGNGGTSGTLGTGAVANSATLTFNRTDTLVVPNAISGTGTLIKNGSGMTALTGASTYSGPTTLNAGTLGVHNNSALGTSTVTAANNTVVMFGRAVTSVANNFVLNGSVTFDLDNSVDYLLVAGGGGGGGDNGGGGGGGGVLTGTSSLTASSYAVTVGAGGTAGTSSSSADLRGGNGGNSSLGTVAVAIGGGGGAAGSTDNAQRAQTGGSGGGGSGEGLFTGAAGTSGQGYAGGNGGGTSGGGGGGAGGAGTNGASNNQPGNGGAGVASAISGAVNYYGGGGGGAPDNATSPAAGFGLGGLGGGGNGGLGTGTSGTPNTGGGGGVAFLSGTATAGIGGSGIVIARYLGASAATGGTVSAGTNLANGYTLHSFTNTAGGTLAFNPILVNMTGAISGANGIIADATGGTIRFSGNSSYTGTTSISGGIVQTNNLNALGNNSAVTVGNFAGVQMQVLSNTTIGSLAGGGTLGGNLTIASGATLTTGGNNNSTTFGGTISGGGSLQKNGNGTFTLTANNSYDGTTGIGGGVLAVGTGGTTGTVGKGAVTDNGVLSINRSDTYFFPMTISGTGSVVKQGAGTLQLTAANSYAGGTTLSGGTLGVYNNSAMGTGTVTAADGTSLVFGRTVSTIANNFTLNGNVTFDLDNQIDYLIVGGGGGGGAWTGGGGGAGGVVAGSFIPGADTSFAVTVGAGGTGAYYPTSKTLTAGTNGGTSSLVSSSQNLQAFGGGVGASWDAQAVNNGVTQVGSGGGSGGNPTTGGAGTAGQGFAGGSGNGSQPHSSGGGGGAGSAGGNGMQTASTNTGAVGGAGGVGLESFITGSSQYYGGGGGGGVHGSGSTVNGALGGTGGTGGGGNGAPATTSVSATSVTGSSGQAFTGGGGGGAGGAAGIIESRGGNGGSGIVIARYMGPAAGTGGTITSGSGTATGYTLHTFTSSGTLAISPSSVAFDGILSGNGGVTADATGGAMRFNGANSYTGATAITGGLVQANQASALGNNSAVSISNVVGAQLQLLNNLTIGSLAGGGSSGGSVTLGSYTLTLGGNNASAVHLGTVSGTGSIVKNGTGTQGFGGNSTFSGGINLNNGAVGTYHNAGFGTGALSAAANTSIMFGRTVTSVGNNFTLNGAVTFDLDESIDYLIVAGGGGGGSGTASAHGGGGGGGGGVLTGSTTALGSGSFSVSVGAGGTGGNAAAGGNGGNSVLGTLTATGGGGGGYYYAGSAAKTGGSGGGGAVSATAANRTGASGTASQGNAGGGASTGIYDYAAGGGGGAGSVGGSFSGNTGGSGGSGLLSTISGTAAFYGGGGGGGGYPGGAGSGTNGGGANGGSYGLSGTSTAGGTGTTNTGGGGGGGIGNTGGAYTVGGAGGSGIVIARYAGTTAGSGGAISTDGGYTVHTFTTTGSSTLSLNAISVNLSGTVSGTGAMTANASGGTMRFSGNNSYTGGTSIVGGTVQTNNTNALGNGMPVSLSNVAGAQLQLMSNLSIGSLTGGGSNGGNTDLGAFTLTTNAGSANTSYAGAISGTGGGLTKQGTGTLTLTGNSSYTGATAISGGKLVVQNDAPTITTSGYSGAGELEVTSTGTTFTSAVNFGATASSLSALTIGKSTNASTVTLGGAIDVAGPVTVYAGSIKANANVTATGGNILLDADTGSTLAQSTNGIELASGISIKTVTSGNITLTGRSGSGASCTPTSACRGVVATNAMTIDSAGNLDITGTSFTSASGSGRGIDVWDATLKAGGAITMTGQHATGSTYALALNTTTTGTRLTSGTGITLNSLNNSTGNIFLGNSTSLTGGTGDVTLSAAVLATGTTASTITTSGKITIQPDADENSFASALNTQYLNFSSTATGLTLGKALNTADITIGSTTTIAGPVNVYGGNITVDSNLTSTGANTGILLKATAGITHNDSDIVRTNGGDITYWANSGVDTTTSTATGGILVKASATIDSRRNVDRTAGNITTATSGGAITLGGGTATTTTALGTTVPNSFALNYSSSPAGLILGNNTSAGQVSGIKIYSGGGNILMQGRSTQAFNNYNIGLQPYEGLTVNAGTNGNLTMRGAASGSGNSAGVDFQSFRTGGTGAASVLQTAGTGSILLAGTNASTGIGLQAPGSSTATAITIQALGTGSVTITGTTTGTSDVILNNTNILAASGDITITANRNGGTLTLGGTGNVFGLLSSAGVGAAVPSSTSKIIFNADSFSFSGTPSLNTSGTVTVQSVDNSFAGALTWPLTGLSLGSSVSGLTIGKATNTQNVTISSATTVAGPVTVYGGDINVNANINTSTGNANGDVLLKASGDIVFGSARTITTNGGVFFDQGSGVTTGSGSTGGGHIWIGGSLTNNSSV